MAATSIHIRECVISHSIAHNLRQIIPDYVRKDLSYSNEHIIYVSDLEKRFEEIKKLYEKKTKQKLQKKATPIREGVIVIDENTSMNHLKDFGKKCQERWGIQPLQIYIHRDEGHYDENKEWKPNYHAHIVFDWQNKTTGKSIKLTKSDMSEMQTLLADTIEMKRGISSDKKHLNHIQYKITKEEEKMAQIEKKRLYTENPNLEIEDLRQENKILKEELQDYKEYMYQVLDAIKELPEIGIKIAEYMKGGYNMLNSLLCHLGKIDKPKQQSSKTTKQHNVYAPKYFGARNKKKGLGF